MRTILRGKTSLHAIHVPQGRTVPEILIETAEDWEILRGPGFTTADLRSNFAELERLCDGRELPVRASDPFLAKVTTSEAYGRRSDYPLAAANAFVVLAQIPGNLKNYTDAATQLLVCVHHHLRAYAVVFGYGERGETYEIRVRCDARPDLERATESIATALTSRDPFHYIDGSNDGVGRDRRDGKVVTEFTELVMREPLHEPIVAIGKVTELSNSWAITRRAFLSVAPRTLALIGIVLTLLSAVFFALAAGDHNIYDFIDGVLGRLATASFGAALIAGTERALDLRSRLRKSEGKARYAAVIEWSP